MNLEWLMTVLNINRNIKGKIDSWKGQPNLEMWTSNTYPQARAFQAINLQNLALIQSVTNKDAFRVEHNLVTGRFAHGQFAQNGLSMVRLG